MQVTKEQVENSATKREKNPPDNFSALGKNAGSNSTGFFGFMLIFAVYMFLQMLFFPSQGIPPT